MVNPYSPPGQRDNIVRAELVEESFGSYTRRYLWSIRRELAIIAVIVAARLATLSTWGP